MGLGCSIARLRKIRGWTQAELAEKAGLSAGYIAAIEEGRSRPSLKALAVIVKALGTSLDELLRK